MTRPGAKTRRGRRVATGPLEGTCDRCDQRITDYKLAVKRRGRWIHRGCAPGADDE